MSKTQDVLNESALSDGRKAKLFDNLLDNVNNLMSDGSWYDIFREIGMTDDEMRSAGLDLPELKVTEHAIVGMVEYIIGEIKQTKMEGHQLHINFSVDELASRFGLDLASCSLAEDAFFEELYSHEEIDNAELLDGELCVKPEAGLIDRLHKLESPELTMQ